MTRRLATALRWFQNRKFDIALEKLTELQLPDVEQGVQSYYIGLCYVHLQDYEKALLYLTKALSSEESFIHEYQGRMIIGYVYSITNRHRLAAREFAQLLTDGFESVKVYAALAHSLYHIGRADESIAMLNKALEIDPENANALNSLGYILTESGGNIETAIKSCQSAVAKQPHNPAYLDSLAMVYYRQKRYDDALSLLKQAYELSNDNEEIRKHIQKILQHK